MTEREFAIAVVQRLQEAGHEAVWAGGCVRDEFLGLTPKDYDVATNALPEQVQSLFRRTYAVGASFGVIEVMGPRDADTSLRVQVATFRSDGDYADGRRPETVVFRSAKEDALRRDFTINGMFFDPLRQMLVDYVGGQADLQARVLRSIGDPRARFEEDKLRLLRAARLAARFELTIEPATHAAIRKLAHKVTVVSAERIAEELRRMLVDRRRAAGVGLLYELGLAKAILPEILPMKGLPQGPPHAPTGDLWDHVLRVLELLPAEPSFPLAFAALLHDVGKPRTMGRLPDRYTFYHHEHVGRRLAGGICRRLKLSNAERERIEMLIEKHQFLCGARQMRTSKLKGILANPGIHELLALHRADALATGRDIDHVTYCEHLLLEWTDQDLNPPALITGHDLMRAGLEPGPSFKRALDGVREGQLDGTIKSKKQALELAEKLMAEAEAAPTGKREADAPSPAEERPRA